MASAYPTTLDALATTRTDSTATATVHVADHNDANDAINKIEAELGLLPKGTFSTVRARLDARTTVRKTANENFTTQVLANVTNLAFPVQASSDHYFKFVVPVTMGAARGVGVSVTTPASITSLTAKAEIWGHTAADAAGTSVYQGLITASGDTVVNTPTAGATTGLVIVEGILANGVNAGTLQLQLRQGAGTGTAVNVVALKGAYGEMYIN